MTTTGSIRKKSRGIALVVTLAVLVIVTVIVVTYASLVRMEITSARSALEAQQARTLAATAVDETVAKLQDAIPSDRHWGAGPGRIYTYSTNQAWVLTELHSGKAADSTTGMATLNGTSAASPNPIISSNAAFPNPDPMEVAWINVLQDGTRSTQVGYAASSTNPIVGRYAYWVDTETSKVNLNTAGKAQTSYVTSSAEAPSVGESIQNLSAHPSRVDLSKLDGVTSTQSLDTYNLAASGLWFGGKGADNLLGGLQRSPAPRAPGEGLQQFNSPEEWPRLSSVSPELVEQNKFYLTTQARTPELNPWAYNRIWWQSAGGPQLPPRSGTKYASWAENLRGNRINAPDARPFPASHAGFTTQLDNWPGPNNSPDFADSRYFVYPAVVGDTINNLQHMGWLTTTTNSSNAKVDKDIKFQRWMENMMAQFNRRDWPGMPARSFVDKYGLEECEALAANLLCLYDSSAGNSGFAPGNNPYNPTEIYYYPNPSPPSGERNDITGIYGARLGKYTRPDGTVRRFAGIGPWPYVNEVAVTLNPTTRLQNNPTAAERLNGRPKGSAGPGFPPDIPTGNTTHINLRLDIYYELFYPPSLAHSNHWVRYSVGPGGTGKAALIGIEVIAKGKYNGADVTYGASPDSDSVWNYVDDTQRGGWGSNFPTNFTLSDGSTALRPDSKPVSALLSAIYVGPFDRNEPVTVDVKFRFATTRMGFAGNAAALQIIPAVEDRSSQPDDPANPTKLTFHFADFVPDGLTPAPTKSLELCDPRTYRYRSDWKDSTAAFGSTLGNTNSVYVSEFTDPLTGIKGDSSKLAWPDVGAVSRMSNYRNTSVNAANYNPRAYQSATNITGFPGIGWLSVLPTNVESGGTWSGGVRTPNSGPIPWRTLSLEPSTTGDLPDWLLLDLFAIAYEKTFLSQTDGKINFNADIFPFGFDRLAPLQALMIPSNANSTTSAAAIATNLAAHNVTPLSGANLPADTYVYAGQLCQVAGMAGNPAGSQFEREALMRDIAGIVTTQCSDFKVHAIAQSLAPNPGNPAQPGRVTAEQRLEAIVSRVVEVGPDGVPATADDMAGPDRVVGTSDDLKFNNSAGGVINSLKYDGTDPALEGLSGRPPFRYEINHFRLINP